MLYEKPKEIDVKVDSYKLGRKSLLSKIVDQTKYVG